MLHLSTQTPAHNVQIHASDLLPMQLPMPHDPVRTPRVLLQEAEIKGKPCGSVRVLVNPFR